MTISLQTNCRYLKHSQTYNVNRITVTLLALFPQDNLYVVVFMRLFIMPIQCVEMLNVIGYW